LGEFDLVKCWKGFDNALKRRYEGRDFKAGREVIEDLYSDVASGRRDLTIDDVTAIFNGDLPFSEDWTKPEPVNLAERMKSQGVAKKIAALPHRNYYDLTLLGEIIFCFREVSLAALVLQHVYPTHFAMCSHFLASQLYIRGDDSSEFYLKYCEELKKWSDREWPTKGKLTVAQAEYALWTWYRLAYKGETPKDRRRARREFSGDRFVQEQRALQIANSLNWGSRLDLARSYINIDPTVAAIIAWRELDVSLGAILRGSGIKETDERGDKLSFRRRIERLPDDKIPPRWSRETLTKIWSNWTVSRNDVMHEDKAIRSPTDARGIVDGVEAFIRHNFPDD
jgi:hypothetical protein